MAIQASKPNSRIFLLLGVALAAAAAISVLLLLRSGGSTNQVGVVVAATSIPAGTTLTAPMVTIAQVPTTAKPADAYTDAATVIGKTTTASLSANTALVPAFFATPALSTTSSSGGAASAAVSVETQIVKGYVAMAIPATSNIPIVDTPPETNCNSSGNGSQLPPGSLAKGDPPQLQNGVGPSINNLSGDQVSAGYYIQPGDHIDILVDNGCSGTRFAFQDVPVLRVGVSGAAANGVSTVYIVEVPRNQAEILAALVTGQGRPFVVKYLLRPQSEWGKLLPDGSKYTPNYLPSSGGSLPSAGDTTVTPGTLDSLFGH